MLRRSEMFQVLDDAIRNPTDPESQRGLAALRDSLAPGPRSSVVIECVGPKGKQVTESMSLKKAKVKADWFRGTGLVVTIRPAPTTKPRQKKGAQA